MTDFYWRLTLAQDPGNAVLLAPPTLLPGSETLANVNQVPQYVEFGDPSQVPEGSVVKVARQAGDAIGVIEAKLTARGVATGDGMVPIFNLTSLSVPIVPGDSGGGIWFRGRVVANTWWTTQLVNEVTGEVTGYTLDFFGAQLPEKFRQP